MARYLVCGHAASATHTQEHDGLPAGHPSCPIDGTCRLGDPPDLAGRRAHCSYASPGPQFHYGIAAAHGEGIPSAWTLAFFEYRGPGSPSAVEHCTCGYMKVAHGAINAGTGRPGITSHDFTPRGPSATDLFYCGCYGWD